MSGNSNSLAPISTTQPSTLGKGRVDLVKSDFDAAIVQKGYDVFLDKAIRCPCRRIADRQPLSSCRNCGGSGYVYLNRHKTRMIVQAMNTSTKFKEWSEELIGSVRITARDEENISFMDRITMIGAEVITSQVLHPTEFNGEVRGKVIYDIKEIYEIFTFTSDDQPLKKLEENIDYTIGGNVLTFNTSYSSWENFTVSVRYAHEPTYHIIDMVRESMTTKVKIGGQEKAVVMPVSAVGRKSHYVLDEQNYNGTYILDNSYDASGCGDKKINTVDAPTKLRLQHPTNTTIDLHWNDVDDETSYIIQRAGLDGMWSQIAVVNADTITYSDTVLPETTYFYRIASRKDATQSVWSDVTGITTNA